MINLRDDGHLETDEPVAAACFLGRSIGDWAHPITSVTEWGCTNDDDGLEYPILIPAKTVDSAVREEPRRFLVIAAFVEGQTLADRGVALTGWLRKHTQENEVGDGEDG